MNRVSTIGWVAIAGVLTFGSANGSELTATSYACVPDGSQVIPPQVPYPQTGFGRADFTLSTTNELSYTMYDCSGLTGVEAHIHGPAAPGQIGPIIFTIPPGPIVGWERAGVLGVLTNEQIRDLNCGLWYVDIHTTDFPFGQVRGQLRGGWGWQPGWPCFLKAHETTWGKVKSLYRN